jgi:predicted SAM-dependent methyltransferase
MDADRGASPDLVARIQDIGLFFSPASVREIRMYHSIGYLRLFEARRFFREAYRLLAQDGNLIVECPDAVKCARLLLESGTDESSYLEAVRAFYAFDMTQVERGVPYTSYVFCWSPWHLERELRAAGFRDVTFSDPETHGQRLWRDMRLVATK